MDATTFVIGLQYQNPANLNVSPFCLPFIFKKKIGRIKSQAFISNYKVGVNRSIFLFGAYVLCGMSKDVRLENLEIQAIVM